VKTSGGLVAFPSVKDLVYDQESHLVCEVKKLNCGWVVRHPDRIAAHVL
jgi:hypothetical protein